MIIYSNPTNRRIVEAALGLVALLLVGSHVESGRPIEENLSRIAQTSYKIVQLFNPPARADPTSSYHHSTF
ncbi:hypothetical protein ACFL0X_00035 [Nanoarchaeota archaeon]